MSGAFIKIMATRKMLTDIILVLVGVLIAYRIFTIPVQGDEVAFAGFGAFPMAHWITQPISALLGYLMRPVLLDNPIVSIRLPMLVAAGIYLFAARKMALPVWGTVMLYAFPLCLEMFSLAKGYGWGLAFIAAAFAYRSPWCAVLAMFGHVTFAPLTILFLVLHWKITSKVALVVGGLRLLVPAIDLLQKNDLWRVFADADWVTTPTGLESPFDPRHFVSLVWIALFGLYQLTQVARIKTWLPKFVCYAVAGANLLLLSPTRLIDTPPAMDVPKMMQDVSERAPCIVATSDGYKWQHWYYLCRRFKENWRIERGCGSAIGNVFIYEMRCGGLQYRIQPNTRYFLVNRKDYSKINAEIPLRIILEYPNGWVLAEVDGFVWRLP